tara:strand:+ start:227 stop:685 length:459 start_codon:yes stop_codon:yes gene_type:complete
MPKDVILIAAVTVDGFIARHNLEITSWSKDLPLFKKQTMNHPMIMGSNTFKTLTSLLGGRDIVVVHKDDKPQEILNNIKNKQCFIIGGGKTYYKFASFLTHLYITPHPYVFGEGVRLFDVSGMCELKLKFLQLIEVDNKNGIFQYQYQVLNN